MYVYKYSLGLMSCSVPPKLFRKYQIAINLKPFCFKYSHTRTNICPHVTLRKGCAAIYWFKSSWLVRNSRRALAGLQISSHGSGAFSGPCVHWQFLMNRRFVSFYVCFCPSMQVTFWRVEHLKISISIKLCWRGCEEILRTLIRRAKLWFLNEFMSYLFETSSMFMSQVPVFYVVISN